METASQIESRKASERRQEEAKPTLIGQLKELREEWGEGFDEDIAQPLAALVAKVRGQVEAQQTAHEKELDEKDDKIDELENLAEENASEAGRYRELVDDLEDVPRGVFTVEEVLAKHEVGVV